MAGFHIRVTSEDNAEFERVVEREEEGEEGVGLILCILPLGWIARGLLACFWKIGEETERVEMWNGSSSKL